MLSPSDSSSRASAWLLRFIVALCPVWGGGCALDLPALPPPDASPADHLPGDTIADQSTGDAPIDDLAALPTFGVATKIPGVNSSVYDDGPHLSADGLRLYFSSDRSGSGGGRNLWVATRSSEIGDFGAPTPLDEVNSDDDDSDPTLSDDELLIIFERGTASSGADLYQAVRTTKSGPFGSPTPVTELNTTSGDEDPGLSGDGLSLVFSSDRGSGGSGPKDIWYASRSTRAVAFSNLVALSTLNTAADDSDPALAGEFFIVFESERGDVGKTDLYISRRLGGPTDFEQPTLIGALSTAQHEDDPFLHPRLRLIIFSSERSGDGDLYWSSY